MIARLAGRVEEIGVDSAVIDVGGVGYLVQCSAKTLARLSVGEAVRLQVETRMRDDALTLFGFLGAEEKRCFRLLTTVQGVGAKSALALMSALSPDELLAAIASGDPLPLKRADGIGAKLAQRIVHELKDKVGAVPLSPAMRAALPNGEDRLTQEAVSALVHLGFGRNDALVAVAAARAAGPEATLAQLVPAALRELAP